MTQTNKKFSDVKNNEKDHILVIDDDVRISNLVSRYLHDQGFIALTASCAADAQEKLAVFECDALIVDVMMPGQSGLELVETLRAKGIDIPVLLLTALGEAEDRITGLEVGADDYLSKPFEPRELVLRLKSILKRAQKTPIAMTQTYKMGDCVYDIQNEFLEKNDDVISLTSAEHNLLKVFLEHEGDVLSRKTLAQKTGLGEGGERTIDVQITRLRRKIEENTKTPRFLKTVRGKGYVMRAEKLV
tara:strand:- start:185 stop:919 length:735 start_codon:yes stop_codon:yes gene_type:complete